MERLPRIFFLFIGTFVLCSIPYADTLPLDWHWLHTVGNLHSDNVVLQIRYDSVGNLYVTGVHRDSVNFSPSQVGWFDSNGFIAKYNSTGKLLWTNPIGGDGSAPCDIVIDSAGQVLVGGTFNRILALPNNDTLRGGPYASFIVHFTRDGRYQFTQQPSDGLNAMALDRAGNLVVVGAGGVEWFDRTYIRQWSHQGGYTTVATDPAGNIYCASGRGTLQKYSRDGTAKWSHGFHGGIFDPFSFPPTGPWAVVLCDDFGGVYLNANMAATNNFGNNVSLVSNGFCTVKFDTAGTAQWGRTGDTRSRPFAAALDHAGNDFVLWSSIGTTRFGTDTLSHADLLTRLNVGEYSPLGEVLKVQHLATSDKSTGYNQLDTLDPFGLAINDQGDIALCGGFSGIKRFGSVEEVAVGGENGFCGIVKFPANIAAAPAVQFAPLLCAGTMRDTAFWVHNAGSNPLTINNAQVIGTTAAFTILGLGILPIYIAPNDSERITLRYHPLKSGEDSAKLVLVSNAQPDTLIVLLSGRMERVEFKIPFDTCAFGDVPFNVVNNADWIIPVFNTGTTDLAITASIAALDSLSVPFRLRQSVFNIHAGDSAHVDFNFYGDSSTGAFHAVCTFRDTLCGVTHSMLLDVRIVSAVHEANVPEEYALQLAPQPVSEHVMITLIDQRSHHPQARIIDMLGRTCWQGQLISSGTGVFREVVDLSALAPGVYVCESGSGRRLFVVRR